MGTEIENLQALLQKDPSNFQARRELSILLANDGFNEEALSNLEYLAKFFPDDAELFYNIGILYEKTQNLEKAKKSYQKAIDISPQDDFYYNLGEVLVTLQDWDNAINAFKTVLKNDPKDGNCYFNLGLCYLNKEETNFAIDNFQKATELNPQDIYAHFYLGNIYQNNGLTNFAIENYNKVLKISPDYSWAYFNLASIAYKNENYEEAKDFLLKTIQFNSQDIEAYKLLTKILIKNEEIEEIITILETRLDKESNGDLYYTLAQVYKYINKLEDYADSLEAAIDNALTLTYPKEVVKKEWNIVIKKLNQNILEEDSETESDEDYNNEDFDEDYDEELDENEDEDEEDLEEEN